MSKSPAFPGILPAKGGSFVAAESNLGIILGCCRNPCLCPGLVSLQPRCLHSPAEKLCTVLIFGIVVLYFTSTRITGIPFIKH